MDADNNTKKNWMSSKTTLLIVGLVILVAAVLYAANKKENNNNQTAKTLNTSTALVSVNESGFTPATLSVESGTQVTWVNAGKKPHQISADPYPSNNSIAGFNSYEVLQKGDSYSFTFSSAGTYHLHDNLNPLKLHSTVIVK
jgi:plastocyanin